MNLIIVESPTKAKTIQKFLGGDYSIMSSYGHVRDLPKSSLGIDIENNFQPKYINIVKARKNITALKNGLKNADQVFLATDPDREGEAIAWHLLYALGLNDYKRITFHEITDQAIKNSLQSPKKIDLDLVNAQQARRILDRLVGYKLSPFLWKKIARGLSAGRVQSVALRLVVEREEEIKKFVPQEYWSVKALFKKEKEFEALLVKINNKRISKLEIKTEKEAKKILSDLKESSYIVKKIEKKEIRRSPFPPFTTSTLQQQAWKKLKFSSKFTMQIAQQLYEEGHITYHRTDSLNLSETAIKSAKNFIEKEYGKEYSRQKRFKTKGIAQEAHEAIRPTSVEKIPENIKLNSNQNKLYDLIWRRFTGSQMSEAVFDSTKIEITAEKYGFQVNGSMLKFDGFLRVYPVKYKEENLPLIKEKEKLNLKKIDIEQHFTKPPARYNEASLIKTLEENGIGRPSTYAPTISTIQERNYIQKDDSKRFFPTQMGETVNNLLINHFPKIVDLKFTAKMENDLDKIAKGEKEWVAIIKNFYEPFAKNLECKYEEIKDKKKEIKTTDKKCPECGNNLVVKFGRFGEFLACSNFPECRYTSPLKKDSLGIKCPVCKEGDVIEKKTKKGKTFYGCSKWPKCNFAAWDKPTGKLCPKCNSAMTEKNGKIKCSNKECKYEEK